MSTQNAKKGIEGLGILDSPLKPSGNHFERATKMRWKKWITWLLTREDRIVKILVATSGFLIGLMLGKGLMLIFA